MGGRSRYATVSLCLPPHLDVSWLDGLYDGLLERAGGCGVSIVGGNLSATSGPVVIDVVVLGESPRPLRRSGARPGDRVLVTGSLGAASIGLALLQAGLRLRDDDALEGPATTPEPSPAQASALAACLRAQLDPAPPLALGAELAGVDAAHAGMDVSDGLSGDLLALCGESHVAAVIDAAAVPAPVQADLSAWAAGDALEHALHGGEDYGLLLAVDPRGAEDVRALAGAQGIAIADIGVFEAGAPAVWLERAGRREALPPRAHQHFGPGAPRPA
jgi:thiamine-monophosphate kinase